MVWDNGVITPLDLEWSDLVEFHNAIRKKTGARFGVATRWTYAGHTYEDANCAVPIPDMSGLVYATARWKRWVILNPEGVTKLVITVPRINFESDPEKGEFGEPRYVEGNPLHIMYGEGSDGSRHDCRFFLIYTLDF